MISIITPTYNSGEYLEKCIMSIKNQEYTEYEHIIVDGGSTDNTLDIIKKHVGTYPMRWISESDNGMYDAISKGMKMAKGDILCWLNSDDIYMPWTLTTVDMIFQNASCKWIAGVPAQINEDGILRLVSPKKVVYPHFCIKRGWMDGKRCGCIQQESTFWKKDLYDSVGGIDTQYKLAGDYHLWRKFAQKENVYVVNTVLAGFRVHEGQKSQDREKYFLETGTLSKIQVILYKIRFYKITNKLLKFFTILYDLNHFNNDKC